MEQCNLPCTCEEPRESSAFYECAYGHCNGHKCEACGDWMMPQDAHCCRPYNKDECPECVGVTSFWKEVKGK